MRLGIAGIVLMLCLGAMPGAEAASAAAFGQGTGRALTFECPVTDLTFTLAATQSEGVWNAQVVLANPYVLCFHGVPVLSMTGAWDPPAGGCLRGQGLVLCLGAAQPGDTVHWGVCRSVFPVCDAEHEFERGTVTLVYA